MAGIFEVILGIDNNYGIFIITFFSLLIGPFYVFSYAREYFNKLHPQKTADMYSVIAVLVYMWVIIVAYVIYYFSEDFYKVFCKRKANDSLSNKVKDSPSQNIKDKSE